MMRFLRYGVLAGVFGLLMCTIVRADGLSHCNTLCRKLGLGWSDGYHAYNGYGDSGGWTGVHAGGPAYDMQPNVPGGSSRRVAPVQSTSQLSQHAPPMSSQKSAPRPTYWQR